ncbi:LPXTG cell wall anchor domain-containing protein [Kitasatospora aureofaciens]|uniref:LPXTG cell wall anchor domain-containing protein n=1 Tax=Kitasatospora aureofaciens TaxID=1894 RepID=UPI0005272ECF|nr:LPXTG cell wall anchor domain-containing protein [Kitasatospora aureofaciens]
MRNSRRRALYAPFTIAAVVLGATAVPAHADDLKLTFTGVSNSTVQIPTKPAQPGRGNQNLHIEIGRIGAGTAHDVKVVFDTTDLAGVADLTVPGCATAGKTITCDQHDLNFDRINLLYNPWLSAVKGATPGSHGVLHLKLTASNAQSASRDIQVDVGGPDFKAKPLADQNNVKPGTVLTPSVEFANVGDLPAGKVVVALDAISGMDFKQRPSNCEFASEPDGGWGDKTWPGDSVAICTVDTTVAPGQVVALDPLQLGITDSAWYTFADITVSPAEDAQFSEIPDWRKRLTFQRGTGPALTLKPANDPGLLSAPRTSYDNRVEQNVLATNTADFSALGSWKPNGDKQGTLSVGFRNSGPASIFYRSGDAVVTVQATIPAGVTVTKVPDGCRPKTWENGKQVAHPDKYLCESPIWVASGLEKVFPFGLSVDASTTPPTVQVTLQDQESLYGTGATIAKLSFELDPSHESVSVQLGTQASGSIPGPVPTSEPSQGPTPSSRPTSAPPIARPTATPSTPGQAPSTTASAASTASPSARALSGDLAHTGSDGTLLIAGTGAAAIAVGGALFVVARRRKAATHR